MPVAEWIVDYLVAIRETIPRHDWPEAGSEYWTVLESAFTRDGVHNGAAYRALHQIAESPPSFLTELRTALITQSRVIQTQSNRETAGPQAGLDRDEAIEASRDCPEGCSQGITSRHIYVKRMGQYLSVGCICHQCAAGRWVANQYATDNSNRLFDLAKYPHLWDEALKYGPPIEAHA